MRTSRKALLPALAVLAVIGLALAGCQSPSSTPSQSGGGDTGAPSAQQQLSFATPAAGAQVTSPVRVSFDVSGTELGKPETGKMHLHVYVDEASKYKILYATKGSVNVPQGMHTLKAVLAQPNHDETSVIATQQVQVSGGAQQDATTTTAGDGYSYGSSGGGGYGSDSGSGYGNP